MRRRLRQEAERLEHAVHALLDLSWSSCTHRFEVRDDLVHSRALTLLLDGLIVVLSEDEAHFFVEHVPLEALKENHGHDEEQIFHPSKAVADRVEVPHVLEGTPTDKHERVSGMYVGRTEIHRVAVQTPIKRRTHDAGAPGLVHNRKHVVERLALPERFDRTRDHVLNLLLLAQLFDPVYAPDATKGDV